MNGLNMSARMTMLAARARAFLRAKRGNVAMIFALALVPLTVAAGAGLDYTRAMLVRQQMSEALDAAALAVGSSTGLTQTSANALAQSYFTANYRISSGDFGAATLQPFTYTPGTGSVQITATDSMPTVLMKLAGVPNLAVSASSTVVWGQSKLWVSLVLDNTGSMTQTDSTGTSKISALITAANQLLTILQGASAVAGDIQVSIVPFAKLVNVGTGYVNASWIDWSVWNQQPPSPSSGSISSATGPGDACPWATRNDGFGCITAPAPANSNSTSTIPSSGTYAGYICPSVVSTYTASGSLAGYGGHYFTGCYTSVAGTPQQVSSGRNATCNGDNHCTCSGSGNGKTCSTTPYTHPWVPDPTSAWTGCIEDRAQSYDVQNTTPGSGSGFPAANDDNCPVQTMMTLNFNWTNLSAQINGMVANGSTNQPIGLANGWQSLTPGSPYGAPALPANTSQYIILVSDGLNTQDRWYGDGTNQASQVDTREGLACTNAKAAGIIIYTIFVDLGGTQGSSAALQSCATDSSKYYDLTTSGSIITTFNQIAQQITNVRVSH
jgi:Flp pilus assembly protein TadG